MTEKCAICKCLLPPKDAVLAEHMTLNRTKVVYPNPLNSRLRDVHHVCLPLKGRKWDYFGSGEMTAPGFFLPREI